MRKRIKEARAFVCGVLVTILLMSTVMVAANTQTVTREITYGINVMLNGEMVRFDYDTRPFVMGGRTFLPLRTLAELLDLPVDFDPGTNTAIVGRAVARVGTPVGELFFDGSSTTHLGMTWSVGSRDYALMGGTAYNDAIVFFARKDSGSHVPHTPTQNAMFNLNGRYQWLNLSIGRVDGSTATIDATVNIYVDDRLVESFEQNAHSLPYELRLFVEGARGVRIELRTSVGLRQTMTYAVAGFAE